jgi:hypothetical protein
LHGPGAGRTDALDGPAQEFAAQLGAALGEAAVDEKNGLLVVTRLEGIDEARGQEPSQHGVEAVRALLAKSLGLH